MRFRVEQADGGTALIVEHDDGGRTFVAESDTGLVAVGTYSAHQVRQMRYSIANREGARKRAKRALRGGEAIDGQ